MGSLLTYGIRCLQASPHILGETLNLSSAATSGNASDIANLDGVELIESDDGWSQQTQDGGGILADLEQDGLVRAEQQPFGEEWHYLCLECNVWSNGHERLIHHLFSTYHARHAVSVQLM